MKSSTQTSNRRQNVTGQRPFPNHRGSSPGVRGWASGTEPGILRKKKKEKSVHVWEEALFLQCSQGGDTAPSRPSEITTLVLGGTKRAGRGAPSRFPGKEAPSPGPEPGPHVQAGEVKPKARRQRRGLRCPRPTCVPASGPRALPTAAAGSARQERLSEVQTRESAD